MSAKPQSAIAAWLAEHGLERYTTLFSEQEIDLETLPDLTEQDLVELRIPLGHRKKFLRLISGLASGERSKAGAKSLERRQITVMFCDLVDSTALSQDLDAEDYRDVIRAYQDVCTERIEKNGGLVAKYLGDGILAYFGYPVASERDTANSVSAAIDCINGVRGLTCLPGRTLHTRVGIATGTVVVGDLIGYGAAREEQVVGQTPNLAARLQALADIDQIVIADTSREIVGGAFEIEDHGKHPLKGFPEPVQTWLVVGKRVVMSRFGARRDATQIGPIVGREAECSALAEAWRRTGDGADTAGRDLNWSIRGDAGIGKSRLLEYLKSSAARTADATVFECQCLAEHGNTTLFPVIVLLERSLLNLQEDMSGAESLGQLEAFLYNKPWADESSLPLLARLLSIELPEGVPASALAPEQEREATLELLTRLLLSASAHHPHLVVVEDLHWADPTTIELVDRMMAADDRGHALLVVTARNEIEPSWERGGCSVVELDNLRPESARDICMRAAGEHELPDSAIDRIVRKADGIPLFIEELTRLVVNQLEARGAQSLGIDELRIPETLQDSLAGRLDTLGEARHLAQVAAAIGRVFEFELLQAADRSRPSGQVRAELNSLIENGFVFPDESSEREIYQFKHALIRDTAYHSLLRSDRRQWHVKIAAAIEEVFPNRRQSQPELLAHHLTEGAELLRAIPYWQAAGQKAHLQSANLEAVSHIEKALELIGQLPLSNERNMLELSCRTALGPALMAKHGYAAPPVQDTYNRALELCRAFGDAPELIPILFGLWIHYGARGELAVSLDLAEQLLRIARSIGDGDLQMVSHLSLACSQYHAGMFVDAGGNFDAVVRRYDAQAHAQHAYIYGQDPFVAACVYSASRLWCQGQPEKAQEVGRRGLESARALEHPFTLALALVFLARFNTKRRDAEQVAALCDEAIGISREHGFPNWEAFATVFRGWAMARLGEVDPGIGLMRAGMETAERIGQGLSLCYFNTLLAELLLTEGRLDECADSLDRAATEIERFGPQAEQAEYLRVCAELDDARARVAGGAGIPDRGLRLFEDAIGVAQSQNAPGWELRTRVSRAVAYRRYGLADPALPQLAELAESFVEGRDSEDFRAAMTLLRGS